MLIKQAVFFNSGEIKELEFKPTLIDDHQDKRKLKNQITKEHKPNIDMFRIMVTFRHAPLGDFLIRPDQNDAYKFTVESGSLWVADPDQWTVVRNRVEEWFRLQPEFGKQSAWMKNVLAVLKSMPRVVKQNAA
jgi:hypothetical protein